MSKPKTLGEMLTGDRNPPSIVSLETAASILYWLNAHNIADATPLEVEAVSVVFDGPPGPICGRFVECETSDGASVRAGDWHEREDGLWELRILACLKDKKETKRRPAYSQKPYVK